VTVPPSPSYAIKSVLPSLVFSETVYRQPALHQTSGRAQLCRRKPGLRSCLFLLQILNQLS
jgi:hypothetical protein